MHFCKNPMLFLNKHVNPFYATGLSPYPLKTSENHWFSYVLGGMERDQWHEIN